MYIIILNVMKIGEKQRTMLARYSMLSATLRVCASDVRPHHFTR